MTSRASRVAAFWVCFGSILSTLAVAELGLRMWQSPLDKLDRFLTQVVGDHHRPGARYWYEGAEFKTYVEFNSRGLRGAEVPYEKPAGVRRILVLGDSFTDALQVPLEQTFVKVMERELRDRLEDPRLETLNAGHVGDGTGNALLRFRHEAYQYDPDIVLLAFYLGNDVRNNHPELEQDHRRVKYGEENAALPGPYFELDENGELRLEGFPYRRRESSGQGDKTIGVGVRAYLARHLYLYRLGAEAAKVLIGRGREGASFPSDASPTNTTLEQRRVPDWHHLALYRPQYTRAFEEAWALTEKLLAALRDEVEQRGARLVVAVIPPRFEVEDIYWDQAVDSYPQVGQWDRKKATELIGRILTGLDISHLILRPRLRKLLETEGTPLYLPEDGHFRAHGHLATGRILADWVEQEALLCPLRQSP